MPVRIFLAAWDAVVFAFVLRPEFGHARCAYFTPKLQISEIGLELAEIEAGRRES